MRVKLDVECDNQVPETACGAEVVCDLMKHPMFTIRDLREWKLEGLMWNDVVRDILVVCDLQYQSST